MAFLQVVILVILKPIVLNIRKFDGCIAAVWPNANLTLVGIVGPDLYPANKPGRFGIR
ncbi:hypothetical protein [Mucilaginibacter myungsuensis]|uniref:Uncharacterized protein n=1 Tax=Mucilaginibacter myungsuensis TaxID=649104 RepID=A0A929L0Q2_9SPHI|nr:hypothetical protein [Mucilaginibacter myungsuensis]MBE9661995.1 hypothetical protein [Mucilaginibacter myungsuensis]MDN3599572.1 hypothetical protein [Mucilaginibacter myungsuensis]